VAIPERFLRDAVLIGRDTRKGHVSDDDLGYLQGVMHQDWRRHWDAIAEDELKASRQNFVELLMPVMIADQTAVVGTTEAVLWAAQFSALPANFFDSPGKTVRVRATGVMTTGATPGTLILTPRYGTTTGGTSLGAGTVSGTLATSITAAPWFLDATVICRAIGASGSIAIFGVWESPVGYTTAPSSVECGRNAVTTIDTTASTGGLTVGATLSNAGSSLTTRKLAIESLN
jgi:hypothetical protein